MQNCSRMYNPHQILIIFCPLGELQPFDCQGLNEHQQLFKQQGAYLGCCHLCWCLLEDKEALCFFAGFCVIICQEGQRLCFIATCHVLSCSEHSSTFCQVMWFYHSRMNQVFFNKSTTHGTVALTTSYLITDHKTNTSASDPTLLT